MTRRSSILPKPEPHGLRREEAAAYVGLSAGAFDRAVNAGDLPKPRELAGCKVWSRTALEAALDDPAPETGVSQKDRDQCDAVFGA